MIKVQSAAAVQVLWTTTAYLILISLVTYVADYNHYTWINIGCWGAYALAATLGLDVLFYWVFLSMQTQVGLGVITMSFAQCTVFIRTFKVVGPTTYVFGNFFMHYAALPQATALVDRHKLSYNHVFITSSIWLGYGVMAAWDYWHDPWNVYDCKNLSQLFATLAPFVLAMAESVCIPMLVRAV